MPMHLAPNVMFKNILLDSGFSNISAISVCNDEDGINSGFLIHKADNGA